VLSALPGTPLGPLAANASVSAGDIVFVQTVPGDNPYRIKTPASSSTPVSLSTGSGGNDFTPVVSPDGSKVAFIGKRPYGDSPSNDGSALIVMNADGTNQYMLVEPHLSSPHKEAFLPEWSPDGKQIAFTEVGDSSHRYISVLNASNGSGYQRLTTGGHETNPVWSPTKTSGHYQIAYEVDDPDLFTSSIKVMRDDGDSPHAASTDSGSALAPQWYGSRIYFIGGSGFEYYTSSNGFSSASGSPTNLSNSSVGGGRTSDPLGDYRFQVSADGSKLTYALPDGSGCNQVWTISTSTSSSDPADTTKVTNTGCDDQNLSPTFVPVSWSMKHFAVLGDSYSSGEGVPSFLTPSGSDGCHRSVAAYGEVLDKHPDGMLMSSFVACSGATSSDVISGKNGEASQLDAITSTDDYVFLTIGGDDVGFKSFVTACLTTGCDSSSSAYTAIEYEIQNNLPGYLEGLFSAMADLVGGKRVFVAGYPRILPPTGASFTCSELTSGSRSGAMQVESDLNSAISAAVATAGGSFEFVDADATVGGVRVSPFAGHELCSEDQYFTPLDTGNPEYSYHPNEAGQTAYAELFLDYLDANP
jgi:hypothetical protein